MLNVVALPYPKRVWASDGESVANMRCYGGLTCRPVPDRTAGAEAGCGTLRSLECRV